MSIEQTNVIDAIGVDNLTGEVVLTITDQIEWTGSDNEHCLLLQEKLNTYFGFVESGEILDAYPNAKGKRVLIDVVYKYPLNQQAQGFYSKVTQIVEGSGMKFRHRLFDAG